MADRQDFPEPQRGRGPDHDPEPETAELAPLGTSLALEDLRPHLPGVEPDRQVSDWGRSERVEGALDRTLYDFLYHYWFRVAVEGIENVPGDGPALLVANQASALAPSAAMIVKAVRQEHPNPRLVHFITPPSLNDMPAVGMLVTKVGGVPDHPANLHRLLFDEHQLVLTFPESDGGEAKSIRHRYRLRQFADNGAIAAALEAGVPIVPVAVVGAEEAMPVIGHVPLLRRLTRLPSLRVGAALPLPAKFSIRFLEAVEPRGLAGGTPDLVRGLSHDLRALIQENLLEMLALRRSVWLG
jgi:1-acyl-sn-glycerol-3-phosphate acyltransferase